MTQSGSRVVEHLAELTGLRDRDVLDVSLVGALKDLLRPHTVAIYRCVGEIGHQHWMTRARLVPGDITATADPLWADLGQLPTLASQPDRQACLLRQDSLCVPAPTPGGLAMAYFPLANEPEVQAVLEISSPQPLAAADLRMVGSILRVYRNFQGLLDYSERDTLTGLLNRKTFDENFLRVLARSISTSDVTLATGLFATASAPPAAQRGANAQGVSLQAGGEARQPADLSGSWLGVIDIDHFKRVNDNFGHLIGDEALLLLSRLMRTSFRFHDHLYRFGGEEFVVLMRCDGAAAAGAAFERLRANVARYVFPQLGHMTVSVGYTDVRGGDSPSGAFERADRAVYWAKQNGRNQVCHHAELLASGKLSEAQRDSDVELF
jgi:diguanylate cyclase (GGDEF)-like protein